MYRVGIELRLKWRAYSGKDSATGASCQISAAQSDERRIRIICAWQKDEELGPRTKAHWDKGTEKGQEN